MKFELPMTIKELKDIIDKIPEDNLKYNVLLRGECDDFIVPIIGYSFITNPSKTEEMYSDICSLHTGDLLLAYTNETDIL